MIYRIYYEGRHKLALPIRDRAALLALRNAPWNLQLLSRVRKGDQKAKGQLLQLAYNLGHVEGALAGCKSIGSYFFHDVDCYGQEVNGAKEERALTSDELKDLILSKKDEIGLKMLERSVSGGWHLVCQRVPGTTILENQVRVATILQLEMDTNAKDLQRVAYSTSGSEEDLPYLDDCLFSEPMSAEECEAEYARLKERERLGLEQVPPGAKKANKHYRPGLSPLPLGLSPLPLPAREGSGHHLTAEGTTEESVISQIQTAPSLAGRAGGESSGGESSSLFPTTYHGIPFSTIIAKYWELNNHGFEPSKGDRDTLTYQLACDLRHICGRNAEWLDQVIPCYDGFPLEQKRAKIHSALQSNYDAFPQRLRAVIDSFMKPGTGAGLGRDAALGITGSSTGLGSAVTADGNAEAGLEGAILETAAPPAMPKRLPKLVQLLTSKTPDCYKAAVAQAIFPPLATHLCKVSFRYTDNVEHEATLMNVLMAGTGAGKGCIDEPIRHIMADIKRRDKENEEREREWKKEIQKKGANKDKPVRPEGLVIQIIDPDMTKPALVTRMEEAEGHFVYVKLNELDLFEQLKGQTGKQHFQLMCLAFDPGAEYGQTRVGTQSVTARPQCRFNWNACTTILKGRRFFRNVLTDGPISRINFCTLPEEEIGSEQPVYGQYDEKFDEALKPYIDNLVAARGLIDCPQAYKLARKLQTECADFARLSQSEVYWNLSHRACVIAWLKACVLYVANGQKWERSIEDFVRWSLNADLWCKMHFFGEDIERATRGDDARIGTRGPKNLLDYLPDEFTLADALRVRQREGKNSDIRKCRNMIYQWVSRGYVLQLTDDSFKKKR